MRMLSYAECFDALLQQISVPSNLDSCEIDKYYQNIVTCVSAATATCVPSRKSVSSDFNVPGWNTYVFKKHDAACKNIYAGLMPVSLSMGTVFIAWLEPDPRLRLHFSLFV